MKDQPLLRSTPIADPAAHVESCSPAARLGQQMLCGTRVSVEPGAGGTPARTARPPAVGGETGGTTTLAEPFADQLSAKAEPEKKNCALLLLVLFFTDLIKII